MIVIVVKVTPDSTQIKTIHGTVSGLTINLFHLRWGHIPPPPKITCVRRCKHVLIYQKLSVLFTVSILSLSELTEKSVICNHAHNCSHKCSRVTGHIMWYGKPTQLGRHSKHAKKPHWKLCKIGCFVEDTTRSPGYLA